MKKIIVAIVMAVSVITTSAFAQDIMMKKKISSIMVKNDKNGNPYTRIFVSIDASLDGIKYTKSVSIMAFGQIGEEAAAKLKTGDTINAICTEGEYKGSPSYQLVALLPGK